MKISYNTKSDASIANAPRHISSNDLILPDDFRRFNIRGTSVTAKDQSEWLRTAISDEQGWCAVVCGENVENLRLFAHHLCQSQNRSSWMKLTSTRWFPSREITIYPSIVVLDSFLAYNSGVTSGSLSFDVQRAANVFDIVGHYYGKSSTIILCPDMEIDFAVRHLKIRPEFMFNIASDKVDAQ